MTDPDQDDLVAHYSFGGLRERIEQGLQASGAAPSVALLGAVDEFHIGGRPATEHLVGRLDLDADSRVLDIGSGLGGTARYIASAHGSHVTGVDLTAEYVEVADWLTELVGLGELVEFVHASASDLPAEFGPFTAAVMVHVGMNIPDKRAVFSAVAERLEPGATFAIYDLLVTGDAQPEYPVPWARSAATSALEPADAYATHLIDSGFLIEAIEDRTKAGLAAIDRLAAASADGPAPLGLHLVMGPTTPTKFGNLVAAIRSGIIAPTEIIARRL